MSIYSNSNLILPQSPYKKTSVLQLLKPTNTTMQFARSSGNATYFDSEGVIQYASTNEPRYTFLDGATCPVLLTEPQSTNLITYSEDFTQWGVFSYGGASVNITSGYNAPDGSTNASKIDFTQSSGGTLITLNTTVSPSLNYSLSIWLKGELGGEKVRVDFRDTTSSGVPGQVFTLTNNWARYDVMVTNDLDTSKGFQIRLTSVDGIVSQIFYAWGAQLEEQSFVTSYIPTNGATATRLRDEVTDGNTDVPLNEGCIVLNYKSFIEGIGIDSYLTFEGDSNSYVQIKIDASEFIYFKLVASGVTIFNQFLDVNQSDMNEIKFKFKSGDSAIKIGNEIYTDNTLFTFSSPLSTVNFTDELGGNNLMGYVKDLKIGDISLY